MSVKEYSLDKKNYKTNALNSIAIYLNLLQNTHMCYSDTKTQGDIMEKKKEKSMKVSVKAKRMSVSSHERTRLVLSCTEEERKYIKVLAALENKTISDFLLDPPRKKMPKSSCSYPGCDGIHTPNEETAKVLKESEEGTNLESHASIEDFWKSMGMKPNA